MQFGVMPLTKQTLRGPCSSETATCGGGGPSSRTMTNLHCDGARNTAVRSTSEITLGLSTPAFDKAATTASLTFLAEGSFVGCAPRAHVAAEANRNAQNNGNHAVRMPRTRRGARNRTGAWMSLNIVHGTISSIPYDDKRRACKPATRPSNALGTIGRGGPEQGACPSGHLRPKNRLW